MFQFFFWLFNWILYNSIQFFLTNKWMHAYWFLINKNIFHISFIYSSNNWRKKFKKNFESFCFLISIYRLLRKYKLKNLIFFKFNFFPVSFNLIITYHNVCYLYNMFEKNFFQFFLKNFFLTCKFKKLTKIPTTTLIYYKFEPQHFEKNYLNIFFYLNKFLNQKKIFKVGDYWRWFFQSNKFNLVRFNKNFNLLKISKKIFIQPPSNFLYKCFNRNNFPFLRFYYLRKTKIFNKSRYSRHRQIYRTGFYWCLWLSVFLGYSFFFIFYRFTLTLGFLWWFFYFFIISFFWSFISKHLRLEIFINEFFTLIKWFKFFFFNFFFKRK